MRNSYTSYLSSVDDDILVSQIKSGLHEQLRSMDDEDKKPLKLSGFFCASQ